MTSVQAMTQASDDSTKQQFNPLLFTHNMAEAAQLWQDILKMLAQEDAFAEMQQGDPGMWHLASEYCQWMGKVMQNPARLAQLGYVWWSDSANLWQRTMERFMDGEQENADSTSHPAPIEDRRFSGEAWEDNIFYDYLRQHYLMTSSWMQDAVDRLDDDLDPHTQEKLHFYTRQWLNAMAPSNFLITNPEVLKAALESNGETILRGFQNLKEDIERGKGRLAISTTDNKAFKVGENIAATPGKVVYQNNLMQLLQYTPQTEQVYETPLLLIPAWINKFYIFDMQQKNSFVRWLVEQGYTVFVISWVNPDARHKRKTFEHYMQEGLLQALNVVREITGSKDAHCVGYCLGGTLLATTLAYLQACGEANSVKSATYLTTMIDFSEPGELGVFIDEEQISALEQKMEKKGYLDGSDMATTFSLLRPNNMIWSFVVNNYLMGKEPFPFDLLYWNSDSTRMPAAMHSYYLRNMYQKNRLAEGALKLAGKAIDLTMIKTPSYLLSTCEDHIAPWKSTFAATRLYGGDTTFVLAGSGHVAGVINPPVKQKYGYWTGDSPKGKDPELWLRNAKQHPGSWWEHWHQWAQKRTDKKQVTARVPGSIKAYPALADAPGSYVKAR